VLGIIIGIATLVVALSVVNGFEEEVRKLMLRVEPHISLLRRDETTLPDFEVLQQKLAQIPEIVAIAPQVSQGVILIKGEEMHGGRLLGISPTQESQVSELTNLLSTDALQAMTPKSRQAFIGKTLAKNLQVKPGDLVYLMMSNMNTSMVWSSDSSGESLFSHLNLPKTTTLQIAGLIDTGHYEYDASLVLMHIDAVTRLLGLSTPNAFRVKVNDANNAPLIARQIEKELDFAFFAQDWTQVNQVWFEAIPLQKRLIAIVLMSIIAIATFNLVSSLVMSVSHKRSDIAILRTMGASPKSIMAIFIVQGMGITVIGICIGLGIGWLLASHIEAIALFLQNLLGIAIVSREVYWIDYIPSQPKWQDILPITLFALAMAFLASLYPSWRATKIAPVTTLSHV
jgi:lipoprotein-releasing system permease protein